MLWAHKDATVNSGESTDAAGTSVKSGLYALTQEVGLSRESQLTKLYWFQPDEAVRCFKLNVNMCYCHRKE